MATSERSVLEPHRCRSPRRMLCSTSPGTSGRSCCARSGSRPSAPAGRPRSKLCSTKNPVAATPGLR
jgi:hypothetical protein